MTEEEIIEIAGRRLMCRNVHQTYTHLALAVMGKSQIDAERCEFGNEEEHKEFFRSIRKGDLCE